jgi:hypothetical protein
MSLDEFHQHVQQFLKDEKLKLLGLQPTGLTGATGVVGTIGHTQSSFDYETWLEEEEHRQRYNMTPQEFLSVMASLFGSMLLLLLVIHLEPYYKHRTPKQNRQDCLRFIGIVFFVLLDLAIIVGFQYLCDLLPSIDMMFYA